MQHAEAIPAPAKETPAPARETLEDFRCKAREASDLLKALSHETRLLILCNLHEGEKTVGELEETLGLQQAVVSQQLARLRADDLVMTRREGRQVFYRIADPNVRLVVDALYRGFCVGAKG